MLMLIIAIICTQSAYNLHNTIYCQYCINCLTSKLVTVVNGT